MNKQEFIKRMKQIISQVTDFSYSVEDAGENLLVLAEDIGIIKHIETHYVKKERLLEEYKNR